MTTTKREFRQYTLAEEKLLLSGVSTGVAANLLGRSRDSVQQKKAELRRIAGVKPHTIIKLSRDEQKQAVNIFMKEKNGSPISRPLKGRVRGSKNKPTTEGKTIFIKGVDRKPVEPTSISITKPKNHKFVVNGTDITIDRDVKSVHIGIGFFKVDF